VNKSFTALLFALLFWASAAFALKPDEILIIANKNNKESLAIAQYYCVRRKVPTRNILALSLGTKLSDAITRADYEKQLAEPIRKKLSSPKFSWEIKCLLITYGVPIKVGKRGPLKGQEDKLKRLKELVKQEKSKTAGSKQKDSLKLTQLQSQIDRITGKETNASVDSELSMVMFSDYELYRWQPNKLSIRSPYWDFKTLMVCRLDGPGYEIIKGLIDKALAAEKTTLTGIAYVDSRGIVDDKKLYSLGYFDESLRDLARLTR